MYTTNELSLLTPHIQLQSQLRQLLMCYDRLASIDPPKNSNIMHVTGLYCVPCALFRAHGRGVVPLPRNTYDNGFHCENIIMRVCNIIYHRAREISPAGVAIVT